MKKLLLIILILFTYSYSQENRIVRQQELSDSLDAVRTLIGTGGVPLPDSVVYASELSEYQTKVFINVKDYGAVGDGVTDNTNAIQTAIDSVKGAYPYYNEFLTETKIIFIPKGNYLISESINLYSGIVLMGETAGSVLQEADSFTGDALINLAGISNVYSGGMIENLHLQAKDGSSLTAIKSPSGVLVGNSNFNRLMITGFPYGIVLDQYAQFTKLEDIVFNGDGMETLIYLTGNFNQIERIDKEQGDAGILSSKPYIIIGDTNNIVPTEKNVLRDILIEGSALSSKKGIYFVNSWQNSLENFWEETVPALDSSIVFRNCIGLNSIGTVRYFHNISIFNTPSVVIDELYYDDLAQSWTDKIRMDSLSYVHLKTVYAGVSSSAGFLPYNSHIKVDKVIDHFTQSRKDEIAYSQRDYIIYNSDLSTSNLAVNGSFENDTYGWTFVVANSVPTTETSEVSSGKMLKIDFTGFTGSVQQVYQSFTIPSALINVPVMISMRVKLVSDSTATACIYSSGAGVHQDTYDAELLKGTGWHTLSRIVYPKEAGTLSLGFLVYAVVGLDVANSIIYVDDVSISIGSNILSNNTAKFGSAQINDIQILSGTGDPEGVVTAPIGSMYARSDGLIGNSLYIKENGTGNTGWVAQSYNLAALPNQIDSLQLWFSGDDELTTSSWGDKSGNNRDLTLSNTPTIVANGLNGHNTLSLNGIDQNGKTGAFTLAQPTVVYIVFKMDTWNDGDAIFDGETNISGLFAQHNSTPELFQYSGSWVNSNNDLALGEFGIAQVIFNGDSSSIRINNNNAVTGNPGSTSMGGFTLGSWGNSTFFSDIEVAEVIVYDKLLTPIEDAKIINYLDNRYNLISGGIFATQADLDKIIAMPDTASITAGYVPKKQSDGSILWQPDISTSGSGTFNPDGLTINTTAGGLARVLPAKVTKWDSVTVLTANKLSKSDSTIYLTPYDARTEFLQISDSTIYLTPSDAASAYATKTHTHTEFFDTLSYSVNIPDTVIAGDNAIWKVPNNITIVEVSAFTNSGTVTFNIEERGETTPNTAGTDVMTSDLVADTDQQETTTFSNTTLDKNDWMALVITSITGDPTLFGVTIYYVKTN